MCPSRNFLFIESSLLAARFIPDVTADNHRAAGLHGRRLDGDDLFLVLDVELALRVLADLSDLASHDRRDVDQEAMRGDPELRNPGDEPDNQERGDNAADDFQFPTTQDDEKEGQEAEGDEEPMR